jgi:oligosaccharide repeat unit polymerase
VVPLTLITFLAQATLMFFVELKDKSLFFLIWPILLGFTAVPILREYLIHPNHQPNNITFALVVAVLFNSCYMAVYFLTRSSSRQKLPKEGLYRTEFTVSNPIYILAGIVFFLVAVLTVSGLGVVEITESTWKDKGELGFFAVLVLYATSLLSGLLCKMLDDRRYVLAFLSALIILAVVVFFRTRSLIAMAAISMVIYAIMARGFSVAWLIPMFALVFISSIALRALRFMGSLNNATWQGFQHNMAASLDSIFESGDLSIYRVYLQIIDQCDVTISCFELSYFTSLGRFLGFETIPRFEYVLYDTLVQAGVGGSLHPTAYGIAYGDFGIAGGALFFGLLPLFHSAINKFALAGRFFVIIGFVSPYIVFLPRGSIYNSASLLIVGVILSYFFARRGGAPLAQICHSQQSSRART